MFARSRAASVCLSFVFILLSGFAPLSATPLALTAQSVSSQSNGGPLAMEGPFVLPILSDKGAEGLKKVAGWIITDIKKASAEAAQGKRNEAMTTLLFLRKDFDWIQQIGAPPHASEALYMVRASALEDMASRASHDFAVGLEADGTSKLAFIRRETRPLLGMINKGLGTHFRLP